MANFDSDAGVVKWCFIMVVVGIPFFIYETTSLPYYVTQKFGFDIVTAIMACIVFFPCINYIFKKD